VDHALNVALALAGKRMTPSWWPALSILSARRGLLIRTSYSTGLN